MDQRAIIRQNGSRTTARSDQGPTQNADPNPVGSLKSVYFGSQQATDLSLGPGFTINATSPAGSAGYVDVYTFTTDGGMQVLPEAFNYGPTIPEVTPNMATQEGGGRDTFTGTDLVRMRREFQRV